VVVVVDLAAAEMRAFERVRAGVASVEDRELVDAVLERGKQSPVQVLITHLEACKARIEELVENLARERSQERRLEEQIRRELNPPRVVPVGHPAGWTRFRTRFRSVSCTTLRRG
jgi:hypothetical protein